LSEVLHRIPGNLFRGPLDGILEASAEHPASDLALGLDQSELGARFVDELRFNGNRSLPRISDAAPQPTGKLAAPVVLRESIGDLQIGSLDKLCLSVKALLDLFLEVLPHFLRDVDGGARFGDLG